MLYAGRGAFYETLSGRVRWMGGRRTGRLKTDLDIIFTIGTDCFNRIGSEERFYRRPNKKLQPYAYPDNMGIQYYGEKFKYLAAQIHYNNDKLVPSKSFDC